MAFLTRLVNNLPFLSSRSEFLHNKSQRSADVELDNKTTKDDLLFMNRPDGLEPHGGGSGLVSWPYSKKVKGEEEVCVPWVYSHIPEGCAITFTLYK